MDEGERKKLRKEHLKKLMADARSEKEKLLDERDDLQAKCDKWAGGGQTRSDALGKIKEIDLKLDTPYYRMLDQDGAPSVPRSRPPPITDKEFKDDVAAPVSNVINSSSERQITSQARADEIVREREERMRSSEEEDYRRREMGAAGGVIPAAIRPPLVDQN